MDFLVALEIAAIAVLSPILLVAGVLHLLSAANIGATGIALNALAAGAGALRFSVDLPKPLSGLLTALCVCFFILAMTANARMGRRFLSSLAVPLTPTRKRSQRTASRRPASARAAQRRAAAKTPGKRRIQLLSSRSWILHHNGGDLRAFTVPPAIMEKNRHIPASDQSFRIVYGDAQEVIEDTFMVAQNLQILLPEEIVEKLRDCDTIQFEILEPPA